MSNLIDMTNWVMKEHGIPDSKWTVINYIGNSKWHCKCECGVEKDIEGKTLRNGNSKSCGKCKTISHNTINEIGNQYGRLTVVKDGGKTNDGHKAWICLCKCGNLVTVAGKDLRNGHTQSCGCLKNDILQQKRLALLEGQRFGKLTVVKSNGVINGVQYWQCKCDCGNEAIVSTNNLTTGNTKSCGCLKSCGGNKKFKNY